MEKLKSRFSSMVNKSRVPNMENSQWKPHYTLTLKLHILYEEIEDAKQCEECL